MSRFKVRFLVAAALLLAACPTFATNTQVGGCKGKSILTFPTISAAVAAASFGATVFVCPPGPYPEQVIITQPLTLAGVVFSNTSQAVITVPASGLATMTDSFGNTIAPMVAATAGPVRILNITVDGTGNTVGATGGDTNLVGIFYASGSSGEVEAVTARNLKTLSEGNGGFGTGIWAENGGGTTETVSILSCSIHGFDNAGIFTESIQPSIFADIVGNTITNGNNGIVWRGGVGDKILSNVISTTGNGIDIKTLGSAPTLVTVSSNVVTSGFTGISVYAFDNVTNLLAQSNKISGSSEGIQMGLRAGTLRDNTIMQTTASGIDLNCDSDVLNNNSINDAVVGILRAPASFLGGITTNNTVTDMMNTCP